MPEVGEKHFAYTKKGKAAAQKARLAVAPMPGRGPKPPKK